MAVTVIRPNNILSIDYGKSILLQGKSYKSVTHFIYSKVLCSENKIFIENTTNLRDLKRSFPELYEDCYKKYLLRVARQSLTELFRDREKREWLKETSTARICYVTYDNDLLLGVDGAALQSGTIIGENMLGKHLMELRGSLTRAVLYQHKATQAMLADQFKQDTVAAAHLKHQLLTRHVVDTGEKIVSAESANKILLDSLSSVLSDKQLVSVGKIIKGRDMSVKEQVDIVVPMVVSNYSSEYKKDLADLYAANRLPPEETEEIETELKRKPFTISQEYLEKINARLLPVEPPRSTNLDQEKELILQKYLEDFFKREAEKEGVSPVSLKNEFIRTIHQDQRNQLKDQLWDQFQHKRIPEDLYIQFHRLLEVHRLFESPPKEPSQKVFSKVVLPVVREEESERPREHSQLVVLVEDSKDPRKSNPMTLAFPKAFYSGNLGYPTAMHYVYAKCGMYNQLASSLHIEANVRLQFTTKKIHSSNADLSKFKSLAECKNIARLDAKKTMNELLYKYVQEALYEKLQRDHAFKQDLLSTFGKLQYFDPYNLTLGVNQDGKGSNKVGILLEKMRTVAKSVEVVGKRLPAKAILSDEVIRVDVDTKLAQLIDRILTFGAFINLPRPEIVPPSNSLNETDVKYVINTLASGCQFATVNVEEPAIFVEIVGKIVERAEHRHALSKVVSKLKLPVFFSSVLWQHMKHYVLYMYLYFMGKTLAQKENAINDLVLLVLYGNERTEKAAEKAVAKAKQILMDYLPTSSSQQDKENLDRFTYLFLLGSENFLEFQKYVGIEVSKLTAKNLAAFCHRRQDRWEAVILFNRA